MVVDLDRTDQPRHAGPIPSVNGPDFIFKNLVYVELMRPQDDSFSFSCSFFNVCRHRMK